MATLSILNVQNPSGDKENDHESNDVNGIQKYSENKSINNENTISIKFGNSLSLLSFKELLLLFKICKNQGIVIKDLDKIDMKNAIRQSKHDPRLVAYARDIHEVPYLHSWYSIMPQQISQTIELLESGMDANIKNENKESIIFLVLRNFDYVTLRYMLTRYAVSKKVDIHLNYLNRSGISPLCQALELFPQEMEMKRFNNKSKKSLHLYEYLLEFGEVNLNDSINKGGSSALGFAFNHIKNLQLIAGLIQRGAILNCREISLLPQLYINMSLLDGEIISPYRIDVRNNKNKTKKEDLEDLEDSKSENDVEIDKIGMSIQNKYKFMAKRINFMKKFAKYKELEDEAALSHSNSQKHSITGGAGIGGGGISGALINALSSLNDLHNESNSSKLSMLYHIIFKCQVHQSCILDKLKQNPLHLYIKTPVTNINPLFEDDVKIEQRNVVTLLKFCCREWLYQANLNHDTPFSIALKDKNVSLLESLLFDEVKALDYIWQLNKLSKNLGEELDDGVTKWKKQQIGAKYENNIGEPIVRNEKLFNLILLNKQNCILIINWIISLCSDILSPHLRNVSIKDVLPSEMQNGGINSTHIKNHSVSILSYDIESDVLQMYIDSSRSIRSKLSCLVKLLMIIDYKNIVYAGIEDEYDDDHEKAISMEKNVIDLVSMCKNENKLYVIQFLRYFYNFSITHDDDAAIDEYLIFRKLLLEKESENIKIQRDVTKLKAKNKYKRSQLESELKAAVFAKIGTVESKADNEMKEDEQEFSVTFNSTQEITSGLLLESLDQDRMVNIVVAGCDKDVLNEENGMYVETGCVIVEINGLYVYGLKTLKIEQYLNSAVGKVTVKFRSQSKQALNQLTDVSTARPMMLQQSGIHMAQNTNTFMEPISNQAQQQQEQQQQRITSSDSALPDVADHELKSMDRIELEMDTKSNADSVDTIDSAMAIAEFEKRQKQEDIERKPVTWLEMLYSTVVESLSTADLITDFFVLQEFFKGGHLWWGSWMVLLMLAPYLVSYVSLGSLFEKRAQKFVLRMQGENTTSKCSLKWLLFSFVIMLLLTPISLFYFAIIDAVFMVYVLISSMLYFVSCGKIDIKDILDDWVFSAFLGMTRMQILGYRRLRTLRCLIPLHTTIGEKSGFFLLIL